MRCFLQYLPVLRFVFSVAASSILLFLFAFLSQVQNLVHIDPVFQMLILDIFSNLSDHFVY